jgi:hypothetical protein
MKPPELMPDTEMREESTLYDRRRAFAAATRAITSSAQTIAVRIVFEETSNSGTWHAAFRLLELFLRRLGPTVCRAASLELSILSGRQTVSQESQLRINVGWKQESQVFGFVRGALWWLRRLLCNM